MQDRLKMSLDTQRARSADRMARRLGWFSLAMGATILLMPKRMARATGMQGREGLMLLCGLREIVQGAGILRARDRTPWIWSRVAGDAMDMAGLAARLRPDNPRAACAAMALGAVGGITALDITCARRLKANRYRLQPFYNYASRSGFPRGVEAVRGIASPYKERGARPAERPQAARSRPAEPTVGRS